MALCIRPCLVSLSFGYDGSAVYIHTPAQGMKIDFIDAKPNVYIEFEHQVNVIGDDRQVCKWTVAFQSVIGFGTLSELSDPDQKEQGLRHIMRHYSDKVWTFDPKAVEKRGWGGSSWVPYKENTPDSWFAIVRDAASKLATISDRLMPGPDALLQALCKSTALLP